jgi:hypothetical protein
MKRPVTKPSNQILLTMGGGLPVAQTAAEEGETGPQWSRGVIGLTLAETTFTIFV